MRGLPVLSLLIAVAGITAAAADAPVIRSYTRLVHVTVLVQDKDRRPVTDLKPSDFIITDEGKVQKVSFCLSPPSAGVPVSDQSAAPGASSPSSVQTQRVFTNQSPTANRNHTVILLDLLNTPLEYQKYAMDQVQDFLRRTKPGDEVALLVLGKQMFQVQDLSSNKVQLQALAANLRPMAAWEKDSEAEDALMETIAIANAGAPSSIPIDLVRSSFINEYNFYTTINQNNTLSNITTIARRLEWLSGNKNLVWVTGGMPFAKSDVMKMGVEILGNDPAWRRMVNTLIRANVSVYPVDTIGMNRDLTSESINTMCQLAEATGGRAAYNTNGITEAIRRAVDEAGSAYELAFTPDHNQWDGSLRKIQIQVNRPGITLRYRRTYRAKKDEVMLEQQRLVNLGMIALAPAEATGINLTVVPQKNHSLRENFHNVNFQLQLDPRQLEFQQENKNLAATVDILVAAFGENGKPLNSYRRSSTFQMFSGQSPADLKFQLTLGFDYDINPTATRLRVVVEDIATGRAGSVTIPFAAITGKLPAAGSIVGLGENGR